MGLAQRFRSLPNAGGVLDQPSSLLHMLEILRLADGEGDAYRSPELDLADLQELL
jgi:hypothetical protein